MTGGPWEDYGGGGEEGGPWADYGGRATTYDAPEAPATLESLNAAAGSGVANSVAGMIGLPRTIGALGAQGIQAASNYIGDKLGLEPDTRDLSQDGLIHLPTSQEARATIATPFEARNPAERAAETLGEFLPNALMPGGAVSRVAGVVLPAAATEAAKEAGAGPLGQAGAALFGGVGAAKLGHIGNAAPAMAVEDLKGAARPVFNEAVKKGGAVAVADSEAIAGNIGNNLHSDALRQANAPRTYKELRRLANADDLNDIAIARDKMRDIASGISENRLVKVGGKDAEAARRAMTQLDMELEKRSPGWVETMAKADSNWASAKRAETIAKEAEKGRLGSFGNNESRAKGFTKEEIRAAKRAHQGGMLGTGLNALGMGLNPFHGGLASGISTALHVPAAIASGGASLLGIPVGMAADMGARALRQRALRQATQQILGRSAFGQSRPRLPPPTNAGLLGGLYAAPAYRGILGQ